MNMRWLKLEYKKNDCYFQLQPQKLSVYRFTDRVKIPERKINFCAFSITNVLHRSPHFQAANISVSCHYLQNHTKTCFEGTLHRQQKAPVKAHPFRDTFFQFPLWLVACYWFHISGSKCSPAVCFPSLQIVISGSLMRQLAMCKLYPVRIS